MRRAQRRAPHAFDHDHAGAHFCLHAMERCRSRSSRCRARPATRPRLARWVVARRARRVWILDSWGAGWGGNGWAQLSWDFINASFNGTANLNDVVTIEGLATSCSDSNQYCQWWAQTSQCQENPDYMPCHGGDAQSFYRRTTTAPSRSSTRTACASTSTSAPPMTARRSSSGIATARPRRASSLSRDNTRRA